VDAHRRLALAADRRADALDVGAQPVVGGGALQHVGRQLREELDRVAVDALEQIAVDPPPERPRLRMPAEREVARDLAQGSGEFRDRISLEFCDYLLQPWPSWP
jgi:hypothetical protein